VALLEAEERGWKERRKLKSRVSFRKRELTIIAAFALAGLVLPFTIFLTFG
jgi:hypothetical protein